MKMTGDNRIKPSQITAETTFFGRRNLLRAAVAMGLGQSFLPKARAVTLPADGTFDHVRRWPESDREKPNSFADITTYNNFYEFGTGKGDPARNAHTLVTDPWSVAVTGEAGKTGTYTLEDILKPHALEDRVYRFRCVEAWSMVVPWVGFPHHRPSTSNSSRWTTRNTCRACAFRCSNGHTGRACAWTRRCIRSPC